ncbi:MAG TPA: hypothetical protein DDX98_04640 [Bacteroidales bacterium]|jgi:hypothetical protein|nr:hypothetical protein [Bacteroidales bacterium]
MKNATIFFMAFLMVALGCYAQKNAPEQVEESVLDFYRQYSSFTDPGKFVYLYEELPDSLPQLCNLIRSQFIHPYAELHKYREQIPKERWNEMFRYPGVKSILEGLVSHDSSGLTADRKPEHRLILGCQQNAILLASILKYRGIPARVRSGHVTYLIPDFHTSHTICEVWNEDESRWMLVDPSTDRVDFSPEEFDFSFDAWLQLQSGKIDPTKFGVPRRYSGFVSIVGKVNTDLASVLGTEYPINQYAPMLEEVFKNEDQLTAEHVEILNKVSELMKTLDAENISILKEIYSNTPDIQISKSFAEVTKKPDNGTSSEKR